MLDSVRVSTPDRPFHSRTLSEPRSRPVSAQGFHSPDVSAIRVSTDSRGSLQRSMKDDIRNLTLSQDSGAFSSSSTLREIFRTARNVDNVPSGEQRDEMQGYHNGPANFSPRHSQIKSVHDSFNSGVFPDSDSGFSSSFKTRMYPEDFSPRGGSPDPGALVRSRSTSRLNSTFTSQDLTPHDHPYVFDRSVRNLKNTLEDSENRRVVLMHKLKEAQDTLELQSERLNKIENSARGNTILVGDLQLKEREYRRRIENFETLEQERDYLKMENIRLRQEMQDRIDKLDFQLRSLQAQHQVTENDNHKRMVLLEQTTQALSMLENENGRLSQDRETMKKEIAVSKEAMTLARSKFEPMEKENTNLRVDVKHLQEDNGNLQKRIGEVSGQLSELRNLTQSMKDENEKLAGSWKSLADEKQKLIKQLEIAEEKGKDFKSKMTSFGAEKDRLFAEKMDTNNKLQQMLVNNEQLERTYVIMSKTKAVLEEQIHDQDIEVSKAKNAVKKKQDQAADLEEELMDYRKANQDLSSELNSVRAYYERSLEQISTLENGKKVTAQQADFAMSERDRLKDEVDKLNTLVDNKAKEYKREKEEIEEVNEALKGELRQLRHDNTLLDNKNQELETKLRKANEDLMQQATSTQQELDTWKDTCDRLTASVSRKESEIQTLSDRLLDMEDLTSRLEGDNKVLKDECEKLSEQHEDIVKLKEESRKLLQEKAENEQMIKLLEMQKEVLTKSSESSLSKLHDVEQLSGKVEQFRNENDHLRERILELEKVRDDLVNQKEELLENLELKEAMDSTMPKEEVDRLRDERDQLEGECEQLRRERDSLQTRHEEYVRDYGPDGEISYQEKRQVQKLNREKEDLEKQVALINGQLLLVESSKKRLDEVVEDLQTEIVHLRKELEEAEKQPVSGPEVDHLQSEIEALREELIHTQKEKNKKDTLIRSLKDESLDDVGSELHDMRGELHKLMGVIQDKDKNIETLEEELKVSKETLNRKERAINELKGMGSDSDDRSQGRSEEDIQRSKSLNEKGSSSGDRLQSLISKYRSYGETGNTFPERKIKPLSLSGSSKMGLVTKGRSFGPAAPKDYDGKIQKSS